MKAAHLSHNRELFKNTVLEAVNSGPQNQVFYPQLHVKHSYWISLNVQLFCQFYGDFWYVSTVIFRYTHHTDISDTSSPKSKINGISNFGHCSGFRMCGRMCSKRFLVILSLYSPFLPHTHEEIKRHLCKLLNSFIWGNIVLKTDCRKLQILIYSS